MSAARRMFQGRVFARRAGWRGGVGGEGGARSRCESGRVCFADEVREPSSGGEVGRLGHRAQLVGLACARLLCS